MSQFDSQRFDSSHGFCVDGAAPLPLERSRPAGHTTDSALDAALRSVPLPQGLLTRLSLLAYTVPDDAADRVDWLGC
jgi:hypothetical protein